jgi:hypothetical protein
LQILCTGYQAAVVARKDCTLPYRYSPSAVSTTRGETRWPRRCVRSAAPARNCSSITRARNRGSPTRSPARSWNSSFSSRRVARATTRTWRRRGRKRKADFVGSTVRALKYFGGVPDLHGEVGPTTRRTAIPQTFIVTSHTRSPGRFTTDWRHPPPGARTSRRPGGRPRPYPEAELAVWLVRCLRSQLACPLTGKRHYKKSRQRSPATSHSGSWRFYFLYCSRLHIAMRRQAHRWWRPSGHSRDLPVEFRPARFSARRLRDAASMAIRTVIHESYGATSPATSKSRGMEKRKEKNDKCSGNHRCGDLGGEGHAELSARRHETDR